MANLNICATGWGLEASAPHAGRLETRGQMQTLQYAHTSVQVCRSNQTGKVAVLRADKSGCYVVDYMTTIELRASEPREAAASCPGEIPRWATVVHALAAPGATYLLDASLACAMSLGTHSLSPRPNFLLHRQPINRPGPINREASCLAPRATRECPQHEVGPLSGLRQAIESWRQGQGHPPCTCTASLQITLGQLRKARPW